MEISARVGVILLIAAGAAAAAGVDSTGNTDGILTWQPQRLPPGESVRRVVLFAFGNAGQGDLFIKKAPACTILDLAKAIKNLFNSDVPEKIIGMRHGEKIYETLATREELARSQDMGEYFRIRPDDGDLNYTLYNKYFTEGDPEEEVL